jgi:hypothetical protein
MSGYQQPTSYSGAVLGGPKVIIGAWFPPFEYLKADTKYPELPREWLSMDPFMLGAPPVPPTPLPGPEEAVEGRENARNNAQRFMFKFGLENRRGECFRNAGLTCLLHNPIIYNFLMGHSEDEACSNRGIDEDSCLTCKFRELALHYYPAVGDDRAILYGKLDEFYQQCQKDFWGPRSNLRKERPEVKVGPETETGGNASQYVTWLIHYLSKQTHTIPRNAIDEVALLKRMFYTTFIAHTTCTNRHRKFLWRKERNWMQMGSSRPTAETVTVHDGLTKWLSDIAGPVTNSCGTKDCKSRSCTPSIKITNAPEILLIRTPFRKITPHESDFFYKIPFAKFIDLSAYSADGKELKYVLQSMSLQLGYGYRTVGHAISIVQAADGKCYKINNQSVQHVVTPGEFVDRAQSDTYVKDNRLLPCFLVYNRIRQPEATPPARSSRKRSLANAQEMAFARSCVKRLRK